MNKPFKRVVILVCVLTILLGITIATPHKVVLNGIPDGVNDIEFDSIEPMSQAYNNNGNAYGNVNKELNGFALTNTEKHFAKRILKGQGPSGAHALSVEETQEMYMNVAKKMGLNPLSANGVNLYEFIRQ